MRSQLQCEVLKLQGSLPKLVDRNPVGVHSEHVQAGMQP
jgi:hypothetical protein